MLTVGWLVAVVDRPAPFVTDVVLVRAEPSPAMVVSAGATGMPDSGSAAVQWMVTSAEYQPAPFGPLVGTPDRVGAEVSPATVTEAIFVLPAVSVAVPLTVVPGGTVLELVVEPSARQVAMPETASLQ